MTITVTNQANDARAVYTADGTVHDFDLESKIFADDEVAVYVDGVLLPVTDYTVAGAGDADGVTVTITSGADVADAQVVLVNAVEDSQGSDYIAGSAFPPDVIEDDFDRRTIVSQQIREILTRVLFAPITEPAGSIGALPVQADRASKYLGFDASGDPVELDAPADTTTVSTYMATVLVAAAAAAARTLLGLTIGTDVLANVVEDTTPQLGAALDTNGFSIQTSEGAAVASAAQPNIWAGDGDTIHITGAVNITDFTDAPRIGAHKWLVFDGAPQVDTGSGITIHGGVNWTAAAGDMALVYADAVDAFRLIPFKVSGAAPVGGLPAPDFTSSEQTVTIDTQLDVAHGLGAVPTLVHVVLRCKTADLGYAVGDEVDATSFGAVLVGDQGHTILAEATNVTIVQAANFALVSQTTLNSGLITAASWKWVVRAWS